MLAIKNNIMAANAARHLGNAYDSLAKSVERLASGLRINSAKDDAAGLAVRELIRADVAVLQQGSRNAQDGISMLQTMEGAMAVIDDSLTRMIELSEQAATGSYSAAQRAIMNSEFAEMADEIDRIAGSTTFNGADLLSGVSSTDIDIHVGTTNTISITPQDMTTASSGLDIAVGSAGYEATSDHGVSGTSSTWLTLTDAGNNSDVVTLAITFTDEQSIAVTFAGPSAGGSTTYSLTEVVEAINVVSLNLAVKGDGTVQAYAMASVSHNNSDGNDYLRIDSRTSTSSDLTMTLDTDANAAASGGFVLAAAQAATSMTETAGENGTDDGRMVKQAGTGLSIATATDAQAAMIAIEAAINAKDAARAEFGYKMNRLENTVAVVDIQAENLMAAESRISDVDVALEMAALTRNQVLSQAGVSMLAQANAMPQMALTLLR